MERMLVDGLELECELAGSGDPAVLVHAGVFAEWFSPMLPGRDPLRRYRALSAPLSQAQHEQPGRKYDGRRAEEFQRQLPRRQQPVT